MYNLQFNRNSSLNVGSVLINLRRLDIFCGRLEGNALDLSLSQCLRVTADNAHNLLSAFPSRVPQTKVPLCVWWWNFSVIQYDLFSNDDGGAVVAVADNASASLADLAFAVNADGTPIIDTRCWRLVIWHRSVGGSYRTALRTIHIAHNMIQKGSYGIKLWF